MIDKDDLEDNNNTENDKVDQDNLKDNNNNLENDKKDLED